MSTISRVSHRSQHQRSQSLVNESYLHWYKSHANHIHGSTFAGFHTEESDSEYLIEDERYHNYCISFLWNPYATCYLNTKRIRKFRHYMQDVFEETFGSLRWIDLPGGQHQVAIERNYLMNYIWLIGYMTTELDTLNKDNDRQMRYRLEELVVQAELLGLVVKEFFRPLQALVQYHSCVEEMGDILLAEKVARPRVEKKIIRLEVKPDSTMFGGNKVEDFSKLLIYARKDCQTWTRFKNLTDADKMEIVSKGMLEIAENLKDLRGTLKKPLRALRNATNSFLRFIPFTPPTMSIYAMKMKAGLQKVMEKNDYTLEDDDRHILECLLSEVQNHFLYTLRFGEMLVEEIWDIILMVRLSYTFMRESTHNNITLVTYEAVLSSKFKKGRLAKLLKPSEFTLDDFYRVDCPDVLRKLPVVVSHLNTEISLHLQGHRNVTSKASVPIHKFSTKRRTSFRGFDEDEGGGEKRGSADTQLLFVSAEAD